VDDHLTHTTWFISPISPKRRKNEETTINPNARDAVTNGQKIHMSEEFEEDRLPGNPRLCDTTQQFLSRQRRFIGRTTWPPGTEFECRGCGDCCKWNFIILETDEKLITALRARAKHPHGSWNLTEEDKLYVGMPGFSFIGICPPKQAEFLRVSGRTWGYWVLNEREKVVVYNPTPCIHIQDDGLCAIYEDRPEVCESYFCRRYPIIP
jgi:Fe-S-cluster containining protein